MFSRLYLFSFISDLCGRGGMEDFSRYLSINGSLTWICCIFCIFVQGEKAEWKTISETVGSRVTLQCNNESISSLTQLEWRINGVQMFAFKPPGELYPPSQEATNLNLNMSKLESQLYELIIESAQMNHTGNYTCETTTTNGPFLQQWRLIIKEGKTENTKDWNTLIIAVVPSVCLLIFIISLAILMRSCSRRTRSDSQFPPAHIQQQPDDIYENCLEMERRHRRQGHPHKPIAIQ